MELMARYPDVVVWLKIRKHDIVLHLPIYHNPVVVWLKIRKHDIQSEDAMTNKYVVVWLKIRKHDIYSIKQNNLFLLWFD